METLDWVGRFDGLLKKSVNFIESEKRDVVQILTSGTPYDILRGYEFASRLSSKRKVDIRLVLHPNTGGSIRFFVALLCFNRNIKVVSGFDFIVSKEYPTITRGTSLYSS